MKLASYFCQNRVSCGIVTADGLMDIPSVTSPPVKLHSIKEILIKYDKALPILEELANTRRADVPFSSVQWLPPVPRPGKLLALAGNYAKHLQETKKADTLPELHQLEKNPPRPFLMPPTAAAGHHSRIPWPPYSDQVDYEIELAVMIGKTAKGITPEQARNVIVGYTIANDISARSVSYAKPGTEKKSWPGFFEWLVGKWSDAFLPLGPWLVTADEIPDPQNLSLELTVNEQIRQKASTSEMIYSVYEIVSFLSHIMTLEPGDVICTGTPQGVAAATGNYLAPGDKIACTIEKIGTLENTLAPKPQSLYPGI